MALPSFTENARLLLEETIAVATILLDKWRLFKHFFSSVRKRGLVRTLRISAYEFWYERKFGGDTGCVIPIERLDYSGDARAHAQPYFPSSFLFLRDVLCSGQIDCRDGVFVDFGSGMGRAMLFASTLPFKAIIGVELSPWLCETARRNLERFYRKRQKSTPQWTIVNADARRFPIPDEATVFYLYNPFDATVLTEVLDRILQSVTSHPRRCTVIYANPVHQEVFIRNGLSRLFGHEDDFAVYELEATGMP
jgi:hypothetical protein